MKKTVSALLLALCLLLSFASADTQWPYTFTDTLGNEVTLTERPEKVAVLFSSYADIWDLAGGEIAVTVGDSVKRGFAEETAVLVNETAGLKIDMEALVAAEPDFVIVTADLSAQAEAAETMRAIGVPAAALREESFEDYLAILEIFTDITGNKEACVTCGTDVAAQIANVLESDPGTPVTYLFIRAGAAPSSTKARTAENHFACVMLDELGGVNIADDAGELSDGLSLESILLRQPDIIFVVPQGDEEASRAYTDELFASDGWNALTAVAEGHICYLEKELFNYKPNARWGEAYAVLSSLLHP